MARDGLGIELRTARTERDLHGAIAVLVLRLHLRDAVRENLDHGHRHCLAGIREYARHARFAADESDCHNFSYRQKSPAALLTHRAKSVVFARLCFLSSKVACALLTRRAKAWDSARLCSSHTAALRLAQPTSEAAGEVMETTGDSCAPEDAALHSSGLGACRTAPTSPDAASAAACHPKTPLNSGGPGGQKGAQYRRAPLTVQLLNSA